VSEPPAIAWPSLANWRRLVFAAVALPTAVVLVDWLTWLQPGPFFDRAHRAAWFFFPWLAVKVSLLAWCSGRLLGPTLYGWIIFFWTQLLLDVQTLHASYGLFGHDLDSLAHTLVSAQIGFLAMWALLGKTAIGWRITSILLATTGILWQSQELFSNWRVEAIPVAQAISGAILMALCFVLRLAGFWVQPIELQTTPSKKNELLQFGIKHMLIWSAALAPLLLLMRGIDMTVYRQLGTTDIFPTSLVGLCTALVLMTTIWFSLGAGALVVRVTLLACAVTGAGTAMFCHSIIWSTTRGWRQPPIIGLSVEMGKLWFAWFALSGALLAGMLLFLGACGYRLAKTTRGASEARAGPAMPSPALLSI
jgi:hypothetical protein